MPCTALSYVIWSQTARNLNLCGRRSEYVRSKIWWILLQCRGELFLRHPYLSANPLVMKVNVPYEINGVFDRDIDCHHI